jgi:hypothetical protein
MPWKRSAATARAPRASRSWAALFLLEQVCSYWNRLVFFFSVAR